MQAYTLGQLSLLCEELLSLYGSVIKRVGSYLLRRGRRSLHDIRMATELKEADVKRALAIMIQHNLVKFDSNEQRNSAVEYSAIPENIYRLLRYPKYMNNMKNSCGDTVESIIDALLSSGQSSFSNVLFFVAQRQQALKAEASAKNATMEIADLPSLSDKFKDLAFKQYVIRCYDVAEEVSETTTVPKFNTGAGSHERLFDVPEVDLSVIAKKVQAGATALGDHSDANIVWRLNFDKFDDDLRHEILFKAAARRTVDSTATRLYGILLKLWYNKSPPNPGQSKFVTFNEIHDAVRKNTELGASERESMLQFLDQYLKLLVEDSANLAARIGDSGGGEFVINYDKVWESLACATLDSIVLEKFGTRALRIFRMTRTKHHAEQDPMQENSLIPAKEAKLVTYKLLERNFLQIQELKKGTSSVGPVKALILFHVDLPQVAKTALETTYKGILNTLIRKDHVNNVNREILEKKIRVDGMLNTLLQDDVPEEEVENTMNMLTPMERISVNKALAMFDQLSQGALQADDSILILESYFKYAVVELPKTKETKGKAVSKV